MSKLIKLKKGLDIKLNGVAQEKVREAERSTLYAVKPTDFRSLTPRLAVKVDDVVKAGDVLFSDKMHPDVVFTSPVSGKVEAVNRGERRKLLEIVVKADKETDYKDFGKADVKSLNRDQIIGKLKESGLWPVIIQRPYGIVANSEDMPKAVFVSGFSTAPLAPNYDFALKNELQNLQTGFDCLSKLCNKPVNLNLKKGDQSFASLNNVEINYFEGPHPAGNVGIQINHINPINKGERVWTVNIQDVAIIGRLFNKGIYDAKKIITVAGSQVKEPEYLSIISGASVADTLKGNLKGGCNERIISGDVLTGEKVNLNGYLGFYCNQISVIPEGDNYEFMGWASAGLKKFSASRLFPSFLCSKKSYTLDTNYHGEGRAFVVSGQYEKVLPMDIYPVYLLKAALAGDIDQMEQLGIYEVIPEDLALCEFVCTSKTPVQKILNDGIDLMMKETN